MLVFLRTDADPAARERVLALFRGEGIRADLRVLGSVAVVETPPAGNRLKERAAALPGVERIESSESPAYRLAGSKDRATAVTVGSARFGDGGFAVIAGPCAVEGAAVLDEIADAVRAAGAHALRGGAFKPRTSPYTFAGLGEEALRALRDASERTGLPVVTEVMDPRDIPLVSRYADLLQVGSRNMQNFPLLAELGRQPKPVLLKRGMAATLGEFLAAAEYILAGGNGKVVLCERGVRTFGDETRNTLDLAAVPALKARTHLPAELEAMIAECQALRAVLANGAGLVTEAR